jgi:hypothetical protein
MMVIDMTAQLAPVINGTVALLVVAAVAVFAAPVAYWFASRFGSAGRQQHEVVADAVLPMAA